MLSGLSSKASSDYRCHTLRKLILIAAHSAFLELVIGQVDVDNFELLKTSSTLNLTLLCGSKSS
jgi:hypothetical protein